MKRAVFLVSLSLAFSGLMEGQWVQTSGPYGGSVQIQAIDPAGRIFAVGQYGVYRSTDDGDHWTLVKATSATVSTLAVSASGTVLIGGAYPHGIMGAFRSTDHGDTWAPAGLATQQLRCLAANHSGEVFASSDGSTYRSGDDGATWNSSGLPPFTSLEADSDGTIFAAAHGFFDAIYRSTDNGASATPVKFAGFTVSSLLIQSGGAVLAGLDGAIYRSTDGGDTWTEPESTLAGGIVRSLAADPEGSIFAAADSGVYRSSDGGRAWTKFGPGNLRLRSIKCDADGHLIAGSLDGAYRSTDHGAGWSEISTGISGSTIYSLADGDNGSFYAGTSSGVYKTANRGAEWSRTGLAKPDAYAVATVSDGSVLAGTWRGLFRSTDEGNTWSMLLSSTVYCITAGPGGNVYAGMEVGGILHSSDNGATWNEWHLASGDNPTLAVAVSAAGHLFAASRGVFRSTDGGGSWTELQNGLTDDHANTIVITPGGAVFVGMDGGIFRSTDDGDAWTLVSGAGTIYAAGNSLGHLWASGDSCLRSTDEGATWIEVNSGGLPAAFLVPLGIDSSGYIYAGVSGRGVFRSQESTTGVEPDPARSPASFRLDQNYPNPCNPSTTITYALPIQGCVTLKVFNVMGQVVATLVDGFHAPGEMSVTFDGSRCSSGMYFYRLQTGAYSETKKLMLLK